jgi:hypothetical protein
MLRIVRKRYKLLYFVVWLGSGLLLGRFFYPHLPDLVGAVVAQIVFYAFVVVAVRSFRGRREAVGPPRPWWRLTGGAPSGFVLAVVSLSFVAVGVLQYLGIYPGEPPARAFDPNFIVDNVSWTILSAFYFHSAVRLRRQLRERPEAPIEVVTTAPPIKGLD